MNTITNLTEPEGQTVKERMAPGSTLRKGLYELGQAYGRKIDEDLVERWAVAIRGITDVQWAFGVDLIIRSNNRFFPSPGQVLEAAYLGPPPDRVLPAIREEGRFWDSGAQAQHVEQTVRENPKGTREGLGSYIRRIAIKSGLIEAKPGEVIYDFHHVSSKSSAREKQEAREVRLPYREPNDGDGIE
jgi:hypothetical protein